MYNVQMFPSQISGHFVTTFSFSCCQRKHVTKCAVCGPFIPLITGDIVTGCIVITYKCLLNYYTNQKYPITGSKPTTQGINKLVTECAIRS